MFKKILCVIKVTGYEHYKLQGGLFEEFEEKRKQLLEESHRTQKNFEQTFRLLATQLGFNITYVSDLKIKDYSGADYDLIITFGGDGTFLNAAQYFKNSLLLGINSDESLDPSKGSVGALTSITETTLLTSLTRLKKGNYTVEKWKRLYAKINGKKLSTFATNDIYFGALESYKTSNFELYWKGKIEAFKGCSGILFSTGMGSTSWYTNLGGSPFANYLPIYGFIVRDAQVSRRPNFVKGIIGGEEEIVLKPLRNGYILSFDSKNHHHVLKETDELRIGLSKKELVFVVRFN